MPKKYPIEFRDDVQPGSVKTRELRKRNRVLEQENEILRRAAGLFAGDAVPK